MRVTPIMHSALGRSYVDQEPIFQTLRVGAAKVGMGKWQFTIRFVVVNPFQETIVIDDMHTIVYETKMEPPSRGASWISPLGEIWLIQDNTIWKGRKSYSLDPSDGYEISLVLEMSSNEPEIEKGPIRAVFGLLLDYYLVTPSISRKTRPSDCIYLFECKRAGSDGELEAINSEYIKQLNSINYSSRKMRSVTRRLEAYLEHHLSLRPVPRP